MHRVVRKWPLLGLFAAVACATAPAPVPTPAPQVQATRPAPAPAPKATPPALRLPSSARPTQYAVELTLTPSADTFDGVVDIDLELREPTPVLWLNGSGLTVKQAAFTLAGQERPAAVVPGDDQFIGFSTGAPIGPGLMHLRIAYQGKVSTKDTQGVFHEKDDGVWYAFSEFEPSDARRAFPCFDEPSFKVPWRLTLRVPKGDSAFSDTPVESEREEADGTKVVRFAQTKPLPSYLVAFAVGPFDVVDAGKAGANGVPVRVIVPKGKASQAAYAARTAGPILDTLEKYFEIPYPYEKLDMVAVPLTVTFGAMENPGMVTFNERLLTWRPEEHSLSRERAFAFTAAHEFAHQWFGDLVTMAWWDDTWLNESFASWMGDRVVDTWKPGWDVNVGKVNSAAGVMGTDSLVAARSIRQPIKTRGDVVNAFDGITYVKGEAVLTMFERYVGAEKFQRGVRRYLQAHAFGNATAQDFVSAISAEAGQDVNPAFFSFLEQPGVPLVTVQLSCAQGGPAKVTLSQRRYLPQGSRGDSHQLWKVPVCVRYPADKGEARACTLLTEAEGTLELPGASCPAWVMPNADATGYYQYRLEGNLLDKLVADGGKALTMPERVGLVHNVAALANTGDLPEGAALSLVPKLLSGNDNRHLVNATVRIVAGVKEHLVPEAQRPAYARFVRDTYGQRARALGFQSGKDESEETRLLRPTLIGLVANEGEDSQLIAQAKTLADRWLQDRAAVEPQMVDTVLRIAARHGDAAFYDRLHQAAKEAKDRDERSHLLDAMASFRQPEQVKANFAVIAANEFDLRESMVLLMDGLNDPDTREVVYGLFKEGYDTFSKQLPTEFLPYMSFVGGGFCDAGHRADVEAFFKNRSGKAPGGERVLAQVLEGIDLCTVKKEKQGPSVAEFLTDYAAKPAPSKVPAAGKAR